MATETTTLEVVIQGKDNFTATAAKVTGAVKGMEAAAGRTGGAMAALGTRLGHAKNAIGGLLTGPLGILGLSAGLFGLVGAMEHGVEKAQDFGLEVSKLKAITGLSAETVSSLASAFEHFGLSSDSTIRSVSMLEKNVGLLAAKKDGLKNFAATFGLALTANGKVKDANALILTAADYFNNKLIPAQTKAAALAKLFGRSWQELVPLLAAGSKGILDAEAAAKDLGLTLSEANVQDLAKFKESTRELGTAMGGLELQIGLALVPTIKDLADSLTKFVRENRAGIVQFFKDAATNVGKFGDFISKNVIPPLMTLGSAAKSAWDAIPDPLKQILVGGVIANKAGKFLFDFGLKDALNLGKGIFSRGGNPAEPLFVKDVGGVAGGGGGGVGIVGALGVGALALGIAEAIREAVDFRSAQDALVAGGLTRPQALQSQLDAMSPSSSAYALHHGAYLGLPSASGSGGLSPDDRQAAEDAAQSLQDVKDASQGTAAEIIAMGKATRNANRSLALLGGDESWISGLAKGVHDRSVARFGGTGLGHSAEIATYNRDVLGRMRSIDKSTAGSDSKIARLQQLLRDAKLATDATKNKLSADIRTLAANIRKQPLLVHVEATTNIMLDRRKVGQATSSTNAYGQITPGHGNTNVL